MVETRKRRVYAARVPAEQRRAGLLDAALHLVATSGHSAVTMDAVAEQAGVSKPVVYGVFANRADLLAALLGREQEQALQQLTSILPTRLDERLGEDPSALVGDILAEFLNAVRQSPDRWHCIVMPMPDMPAEFHAARERARTVTLSRAEEMARWLLDLIDAPDGLDAEILAHTVVTLFEMAARMVLTDPERFRPNRFVTAVRAAIGLTQARVP